MPKVLLLNGPNLNMLGQRQPEIYGAQTLAQIHEDATAHGLKNGLEVTCFQSNHEGALVEKVQEARGMADGIVINPAAYSHSSIAILDALHAYEGLVVEVHLSNIHKREAFRHHSYISARADVVICGAGGMGYHMALDWLAAQLVT